MKTLEQLRMEALLNNNSGSVGQFEYARSLQKDMEDYGNFLSNEEAWRLAGKYLK